MLTNKYQNYFRNVYIINKKELSMLERKTQTTALAEVVLDWKKARINTNNEVEELVANSTDMYLCGRLIDLMTNTGKLTSIDRHGLNKLNRAPLAKASFEMPIDQLLKAAEFNEVDPITSISSQIIVGRSITAGTGVPQLMLDVDMIQNTEYIEDTNYNSRSNFVILEIDSLLDDLQTKEIGDIFLPMM